MLVCGAASQNKAPVTIATFDHPAIVNFKPDTGVTKGEAAGNIARAVAGNAARFDGDGFRVINHGPALSNGGPTAQLLIV